MSPEQLAHESSACLDAVRHAIEIGACPHFLKELVNVVGIHAERNTRGGIIVSMDGAKAWWSGSVPMIGVARRHLSE